MSDAAHRTCPSCGATLPADASQCDLCGTELSDETEPQAPDANLDGVYCNECGWKNPAGANFCSRCGSALDSASVSPVDEAPAAAPAGPSMPPPSDAAAPRPESTQQSDLGRKIGVVVAGGILLVLAFFLIDAFSSSGAGGDASAPTPTAPAMGGAMAASTSSVPPDSLLDEGPPLASQIASRVDSLESALETVEGAERLSLQRELVNLLIGGGRRDRAAVVQRRIAMEQPSAETWRRAGHLFYDWMASVQDPMRRRQVANFASEAYREALSISEGDLDIRADLATALLESDNPMAGVQEIKAVLDEDPNHVEARLNYGIMLLRIQRTDQAYEQFDRVLEISEEGSVPYRRAQEILNLMEERGMQSGASPAS